MQLVRYTAWPGTLASLSSLLALMAAAKREGRSIWQPANATSHWLHGAEAGSIRRLDGRHTLLGFATHHLSAMFWGVPFGLWLMSRPTRTALELLRDAAAITGFAAAFDYLVMPRRLRPGWELVLSRPAMAYGFGAMAFGLALGGLLAQSRR